MMFAVRRLPLFLTVALISFVPHCVPADSAPVQSPIPWTQARIQKKSYKFEEAGKEIPYALYVPKSYDKARKTPLVVALHGLYSSPQQILWYPGMTDQAEKYGYLLVAPMGYNDCGWYGARPLVRPRGSQPENLCELSEKDVLNVLGIVRDEYNVDPDRIYLLGHSMGGGGTWHLGIKYPEIWAALAPIAPASSRPPTDLEKIRHLPVILVQGERDMLVRAKWVRPWAEQMKKLGMTHKYIEVPGGDHVTVAFKTLPDIFDFFEKHRRRGAGADRE